MFFFTGSFIFLLQSSPFGYKIDIFPIDKEKEGDAAMGYFEDALGNFVRDFHYGGAVRHMLDRGYTVDQIIRSGEVSLSRENIEKIAEEYKRSRESSSAE